MKIISNIKDYYDYLVSFYGMDDYVVFDRRKNKVLRTELQYDLLWSKDLVFETIGDNYYFCCLCAGNNFDCIILKRTIDNQVEKKVVNIKLIPWNKYVPNWNSRMFSKEEYLDRIKDFVKSKISPENPLIFAKINCNRIYYPYYKTIDLIFNPILKDTPFTSIMKPEKVWEGIYNYLLSCKEPKIIDNRTDIEHLESAGFDKKTSFRNIK